MQDDSWKRPIHQPQSLPGQRLLFEDQSVGYGKYVDAQGQKCLLDIGHDLPGRSERRQTLLWDV